MRGVAVQKGAAGHVGEDVVQIGQFRRKGDAASITVGCVKAVGLNRSARGDDVEFADRQAKRIHDRIDFKGAAPFKDAVSFGNACFGAGQSTIRGHVEMTRRQAVAPVGGGFDRAAKGTVRKG